MGSHPGLGLPVHILVCQINPKCANCNGPHRANSRSCLYMKKAYEIEKEKNIKETQDAVNTT